MTLRADAPSFVPRCSTATTAITSSTETKNKSSENSNNQRNNKPKRTRKKKKEENNDKNSIQKSDKDNLKIGNDNRNNKNSNRRSRRNFRKKEHQQTTNDKYRAEQLNNRGRRTSRKVGKNSTKDSSLQVEKEEEDSSELIELSTSFFPALNGSSPDITNKQNGNSIWSTQCSAIRNAPTIIDDSPKQDDGSKDEQSPMSLFSSGLCRLEPLHYKRKETFGTQQNKLQQNKESDHEDDKQDITPKPLEKDTVIKLRYYGKNINKLRDRWWDLMEQHRLQQKVKQKQEELERQEQLQNEPESAEDHADSVVHASQRHNDNHVDHHSRDDNHLEISSCHAYYDEVQLPIHEAIRRDDAVALQQLLRKAGNDTPYTTSADKPPSMSPLQLAVHLNMPHLVRIICNSFDPKLKSLPEGIFGDHCNNSHYPPALLIAAERGYEECLQYMLASFGSVSLLTTRDRQGNTALHSCCADATSASIFQFILEYAMNASNGSAATASFLFKLLSSKNDKKQTPLHVACQCGRADIVDIMLNHRHTSNISMLSKLFALQDIEGQTPMLSAVAAGSTDIVMSLLMWRGNNLTSARSKASGFASLQPELKRKQPASSSSQEPTSCPLLWAVRCRNVDMVTLLLEFNDSSSNSGYNVDNALRELVRKSPLPKMENYANETDIARVLIASGANPCSLPNNDSKNSKSIECCAMTLASENGDVNCLVAMVDSYQRHLLRQQHKRRCDPKLQNQPETFFSGLESIENSEKKKALQESLIMALFYGWKQMSSDKNSLAGNHFSCALALYRRGVLLDELRQFYLSKSMLQNSPVLQEIWSDSDFVLPSFHFETSCTRPDAKIRSTMLLHMPWFSHKALQTNCAWLSCRANCIEQNDCCQNTSHPDVILVCSDGARFVAHQAVISDSVKLSAAMRFASMSRESLDRQEADHILEVEVNLQREVCRWLLEHLYHGSIVSNLPDDPNEFCNAILDLLLTAEEFICPSLIQECEMRLLAAENNFRTCFCWNCHLLPGFIDLGKSTVDLGFCNLRVSGPSKCINPKNAVEVLAVTQQIEGSLSAGIEYTINKKSNYKNTSWGNSNESVLRPFEAVREAVLKVILADFDTVAQSPAFASLVDIDESKFTGSEESLDTLSMFLYMVLEEFCSIARSNGSRGLQLNHSESALSIDKN